MVLLNIPKQLQMCMSLCYCDRVISHFQSRFIDEHKTSQEFLVYV